MRVLVIDDDKAILQAIKMVLTDCGCKTFIFESAEKIEKLVKEKKPDLIFLDIMLSGLNGLNTIKLLKAKAYSKNIPLVIISARADVAAESLESGADDFLAKPFDINDLVEMVGKYRK